MPGNAKKKCPKKAGNLVVQVRQQRSEKPKKWNKLSGKCELEIIPQAGQVVDSPKGSIRNKTTFKNLCAGAYTLALTPHNDHKDFEITEALQKTKPQQKIGTGPKQRPVQIIANKTVIHYYKFYPWVLRAVVVDDMRNKIRNMTVKATPTAGGAALTAKSNKSGEVDFGFVKKGKYTLEVVLTNEEKEKYRVTLPGANGGWMRRPWARSRTKSRWFRFSGCI